MIMLKFLSFLFLFSIFFRVSVFAQDTAQNSPFTFSGYVDAYGAYYTDSVGINNFQKFPTVSPRSQQIGLNIAMLTAKYSADKVRGVITLQYGDIPKSSWSSTYNFIQEANAGVRITEGLRLDGGFFRSHIGCEGLLPKENITSSIAIPTYYEPYYEAGFKLSYAATQKLALSLFLLNGYNLFEDNNTEKSGGMLAGYTFNDNTSLTYANYFGNDAPEGDSISKFKFFNNLFLNYKINKFRIVSEIDFCVQENSNLTNVYESASLWCGLFTLGYQAAKKIDVYCRGEIYDDPNGILSGVFLN